MSAQRVVEGTLRDPRFWLREGDPGMAEVVALEGELLSEFPELQKLDLCTRSGAVHVNSIVVRPEHRGKGVGRRAVERVKAYAGSKGLPVTLSPVPERGRKADLQRFYTDLGFWRNHGRQTDYRYSSPFAPIMIWKPTRM